MELWVMSEKPKDGNGGTHPRVIRVGIAELLVVIGMVAGSVAWITNIALAQGRQENRLGQVEKTGQEMRKDLSSVLSVVNDTRERLVRVETLLKDR